MIAQERLGFLRAGAPNRLAVVAPQPRLGSGPPRAKALRSAHGAPLERSRLDAIAELLLAALEAAPSEPAEPEDDP